MAMFRSVTFKLTMYYLAIIAVISIGFSAVLYHTAAKDLAYGLREQRQRISDNFPVFHDSPYLQFNEELQERRSHLLGILVAWNMVVLGVAGVASYALARRTLRPIEVAHEQQKRFTADVSHELRTPLTALKMESEVALLDDAATKAQLKETLASNIEEAEKLTLLVSNLLRLSQLDSDERMALHSRLDLPDVVQAAVKQLQPVADQRNIALNTNLTASAAVQGDATTLTQLFVILLDNAIKYSPADTAVTLSSSVQPGSITVKIADQGAGIAKADLEHIFERFYRADSARTSGDSSGFGLGLSIAKLIADSHRASICITSKVGKGTTAAVTIPTADR